MLPDGSLCSVGHLLGMQSSVFRCNLGDRLNVIPIVAVLRYLHGTEVQALAAHSHIQVQT